ncbi:hypothetical protein Zmor_002555 [Zophobas morio]|uniref:Uncharacterized protein n=1 Tax=Zophobas morio TaxID=2755281 RepID=A0AA38J0V6_9CUCU|nr:hypothetical protein Zmor_002555 [Zophobas morio]
MSSIKFTRVILGSLDSSAHALCARTPTSESSQARVYSIARTFAASAPEARLQPPVARFPLIKNSKGLSVDRRVTVRTNELSANKVRSKLNGNPLKNVENVALPNIHEIPLRWLDLCDEDPLTRRTLD